MVAENTSEDAFVNISSNTAKGPLSQGQLRSKWGHGYQDADRSYGHRLVRTAHRGGCSKHSVNSFSLARSYSWAYTLSKSNPRRKSTPKHTVLAQKYQKSVLEMILQGLHARRSVVLVLASHSLTMPLPFPSIDRLRSADSSLPPNKAKFTEKRLKIAGSTENSISYRKSFSATF